MRDLKMPVVPNAGQEKEKFEAIKLVRVNRMLKYLTSLWGVYFKINNGPTLLPKCNVHATLLQHTTAILQHVAIFLYATFVPTAPTDTRVP